MDFYKTTQTVRLPAGTVLLLTRDQFKARAHLLADKVDGLTVANELIEFKAGEIIGLGQVPLALKSSLEPVEFEDGGELAELFELFDFETDDFDESENVAGDVAGIDQAIASEFSPGDVIGIEKTTESVIEERPDNGDPEAEDNACTDGLGTDMAVVYDKPVATKPKKTG